MKKIVAYRFVVRALSCVAVLSLIVLRLSGTPARAWYTVPGGAFLGGCFLLLLYPLKGENSRFAAIQAGMFTALMGMGECLPRLRHPLWSALLPLLLLVILWERRKSQPRLVARETRLWYALLVLVLQGFGDGVLLAPLYLLLYMLSFCGDAYNLMGFLRHSRRQQVSGKCDPAQMKVLFERIEALLSGEQPFLNANFREEELARTLFTNRAYLSQTINEVAGMNFKMLINTYRIRYAIALMQERPDMNIKQIASRSGFNSSNVFLSSFRQITGENPQKFLSRLREQGP